MSNTKKFCHACGKSYMGLSCPTCRKEDEKTGWEKFECDVCNKPAFQPVGAVMDKNGRWTGGVIVCKDCFYKEYEKDYKFTATPEQVARFLIKSGSKSIFWKKATEGQKQYAINYAKITNYKPSPKVDYGMEKASDVKLMEG